jgi:hypothetical protein
MSCPARPGAWGTLAVSLGPTGRGERPGNLNEKKRFKKNLKGWFFLPSPQAAGSNFQLSLGRTREISGWVPEREHTAPNGKCHWKLLRVDAQ